MFIQRLIYVLNVKPKYIFRLSSFQAFEMNFFKNYYYCQWKGNKFVTLDGWVDLVCNVSCSLFLLSYSIRSSSACIKLPVKQDLIDIWNAITSGTTTSVKELWHKTKTDCVLDVKQKQIIDTLSHLYSMAAAK